VVFYALFGRAAAIDPETNAALALTLFFVARIGAGVAGATIATAQAVIADSTPPEKRKHGMALIGAAFGIGFTFGPLIGYACLSLGNGQFSLIGYTASALSAIAWILGLALLPETRVKPELASEPAGDAIKEGMPPYRPTGEPAARRNWIDWSATRAALANPAIGPVIFAFFIASLGFGAFEVTLALFLKDSFDYAENDSFLIFAYIGFVLLLTQGVIYRGLASRLSEVTFMALGIAFMLAGVALQALINFGKVEGHTGLIRLDLLFAALTCAVIGFAFLTPSAQALVSRRTPADRQGEILGVNQSASALARILGPVCGVTLYKATESHLLPYIGGAVLLVLMLPLLPWIRRHDAAGT
jgi:MFS family permease